MSQEFHGKIIAIGALEQYTNSKGEGYSREITVETDEQYPQRGTFTLNNDQAEKFDKAVGDTVTVKYYLAGFQSSREPGKWYNKLRAWRVE